MIACLVFSKRITASPLQSVVITANDDPSQTPLVKIIIGLEILVQ